MRFLAQLFAVFGAQLRDDLMRPINPLIAIAGAAGTAFILISLLAVAAGLTAATAASGSEDVALILSRDAATELVSSLSEEERVSAVDAIANAGVDRNGIRADLVRTMDTISRGGEAGSQVISRGLEPQGIQAHARFRIVAGRLFEPGRYEVIVGRRLARDFAGLSIGDTVTGSAQEWRVVGIFEDGGSIGESEVWTDLQTARMEGGRQGGVSALRVRMDSASELRTLRGALAARPDLRSKCCPSRNTRRD